MVLIMSNIECINGNDIQAALKKQECVYLCGDLKLPQVLKEIKDDKIEIGYCSYEKYEAKLPHFHPLVTEYQYLLKGECKYLDLTDGVEYNVKEGDFYIIRPNTRYIQKVKPNTEILFVKAPGMNDKTKIELDERIKKWAESWEHKY